MTSGPLRFKPCLYQGLRQPRALWLVLSCLPTSSLQIARLRPVGGIYQNNHRVPTQSNPQLDNFAPRVGLAWQPTEERSVRRARRLRLFLRLYRLSDLRHQRDTSGTVRSDHRRKWNGKLFLSEAQPYAPTPLEWTPRWVNFATGASSNIADYIMQQKYVTPLTYEYNLNTQYEFLPNLGAGSGLRRVARDPPIRHLSANQRGATGGIPWAQTQSMRQASRRAWLPRIRSQTLPSACPTSVSRRLA